MRPQLHDASSASQFSSAPSSSYPRRILIHVLGLPLPTNHSHVNRSHPKPRILHLPDLLACMHMDVRLPEGLNWHRMTASSTLVPNHNPIPNELNVSLHLRSSRSQRSAVCLARQGGQDSRLVKSVPKYIGLSPKNLIKPTG
ncbi:hypothetical protein RSAG8_12503, partial [Rhizoctonia solani AG-8 WAC10335]